jgi:hypothetical protein
MRPHAVLRTTPPGGGQTRAARWRTRQRHRDNPRRHGKRQ